MKFLVSARGHQILCDRPAVAGGTDAGITPPEFLLASLATCAGYYAAEYLRARSLPLNGLEVHVNAEKALNPGRLAKFEIDVTAPDAGGEERHKDGVLWAVRRSLIHNTLGSTTAPEVELGWKLRRVIRRSSRGSMNVFHAKIFRNSLAMCRQREDAEEAPQETLLQVFRSIDQLRDPEHVRAWVFRIARNSCFMKRRRSQSRPNLRSLWTIFIPAFTETARPTSWTWPNVGRCRIRRPSAPNSTGRSKMS